jgi:hypothetical protein
MFGLADIDADTAIVVVYAFVLVRMPRSRGLR